MKKFVDFSRFRSEQWRKLVAVSRVGKFIGMKMPCSRHASVRRQYFSWQQHAAIWEPVKPISNNEGKKIINSNLELGKQLAVGVDRKLLENYENSRHSARLSFKSELEPHVALTIIVRIDLARPHRKHCKSNHPQPLSPSEWNFQILPNWRQTIDWVYSTV